MKIQDFFKKWTSTRPNLKTEFHDAGIESMAFAEAYYNEQLRLHNVMYWRDIDKEMPPEHEKVLVQLPDDVVLMGQMDSNGGWGIYWADGQKSMDEERPVLKWAELPACT